MKFDATFRQKFKALLPRTVTVMNGIGRGLKQFLVFSSKSRVVNTVFPQPEGPAIIKLVGGIKLKRFTSFHDDTPFSTNVYFNLP